MGITTNVKAPDSRKVFTLEQLRERIDLRGKVFQEVTADGLPRRVATRVVVFDAEPQRPDDPKNYVMHVSEKSVSRRWLDGADYYYALAGDDVTITISNK